MKNSTLPLTGWQVLITRAAHQAEPLQTALRAVGATVLLFPTIAVQPVDDIAPFDAALRQRAQYDWLLLTSQNAVTSLLTRLQTLNLSPSDLDNLQIGAVGPATAARFEAAGGRISLLPETDHTAEGLLAALPTSLSGQRVLLPQADRARPILRDSLTERGAQVTALTVYHTVPRTDGQRPPYADIVTFTSPSTVQGYLNGLGRMKPAAFLADSRVVCIGPVTTQAAEALGVPVTATATPHTIDGLVDCVVSVVSQR